MRSAHAKWIKRREAANDEALNLISVRPSWLSRPLRIEADPKGSPLSEGSRQWDLKNDPSLPPITRRVVAGPSLIETSFQRAWKTIYPVRIRGERKVLAIKHDHISAREILSRAQSILRAPRVCEKKSRLQLLARPTRNALRYFQFLYSSQDYTVKCINLIRLMRTLFFFSFSALRPINNN